MNKHTIQEQGYKEHRKDENSVENSEIILELELAFVVPTSYFLFSATFGASAMRPSGSDRRQIHACFSLKR